MPQKDAVHQSGTTDINVDCPFGNVCQSCRSACVCMLVREGPAGGVASYFSLGVDD